MNVLYSTIRFSAVLLQIFSHAFLPHRSSGPKLCLGNFIARQILVAVWRADSGIPVIPFWVFFSSGVSHNQVCCSVSPPQMTMTFLTGALQILLLPPSLGYLFEIPLLWRKSCTLKCECSSSLACCHCLCPLPTPQCSCLHMHSLPGCNSRHCQALQLLLDLGRVDWPQRTESCLHFICFPSAVFRNHAEPKSAFPSGHNPALCGRRSTATSCSSSLPHLPKDADPLRWLTASWAEYRAARMSCLWHLQSSQTAQAFWAEPNKKNKTKPLRLQMWGFFVRKKGNIYKSSQWTV